MQFSTGVVVGSVSGSQRWLASCAQGLAPLLVDELLALGATEVAEGGGGVYFHGPTAIMYRTCLWSRLASRVYLPLDEGDACDADNLHALLYEIPWHTLIADGVSIAVDFQGTNKSIRDTRFGAQRSKDAISDQLRSAGLGRPRVDPRSPDLRISVRLRGKTATVALDMAGESLHRRGYRKAAGTAPLKENLAAALLLRAGWPELAKDDGALIDPMCGSGTLLIEGALMAADCAPGLERKRYGFAGWRGHEAQQWQAVVADARARAERGLQGELPEIRGYDGDPRVIARAQENIATAGLSRVVRVSVKALGGVVRPTHRPLSSGLVITNPPYGERLGDRGSLEPLYRRLGELLHAQFQGWRAAVLTGDKALGQATGLRSHRQYALWNGRLPVSLLLFELVDNVLKDASSLRPATPDPWAASRARDAATATAESSAAPEASSSAAAKPVPPARVESVALTESALTESALTESALSEGARMFANRLQKNQRRLQKWLRHSGEECYRLYDADMPEYAVAIDRYGERVHVAEYRAPNTVDSEAAQRRMDEVLAALPQATGVDSAAIVVKSRSRQRGEQQYERQGEVGEFLSVREGRAQLLVNLTDYLDTGLFLDHRALRRRIASEARGKRFLNLFCYTGTATVQAALGGARRCTSVDMSNTYLRWLRRNLAHNGLAESAHDFERADCLSWLEEGDSQFDLIMLDPPSFSNSARMEQAFDVQRDHESLVQAAMRRLAPEGTLYFSTNKRRFRIAEVLSERFTCLDITEETLDPDFPRRPPPHRCWAMGHRVMTD